MYIWAGSITAKYIRGAKDLGFITLFCRVGWKLFLCWLAFMTTAYLYLLHAARYPRTQEARVGWSSYSGCAWDNLVPRVSNARGCRLLMPNLPPLLSFSCRAPNFGRSKSGRTVWTSLFDRIFERFTIWTDSSRSFQLFERTV